MIFHLKMRNLWRVWVDKSVLKADLVGLILRMTELRVEDDFGLVFVASILILVVLFDFCKIFQFKFLLFRVF
jgi:hypothetical protein